MQPGAIPREKIPWFPTVDEKLCIGDQECFHFCKNGVFAWDEENARPIVQNPYQCVVGCQACLNICAAEAIRFPGKEELRETLKRLRAEMQQSEPEPLVRL